MEGCQVLKVNDLTSVFSVIPELEFVVLIGSQADGTARPDSDWDFAVRWKRVMNFMEQLSATEGLRKNIANHIATAQSQIDIIDLSSARLAMRAVVAEEGRVLYGDHSLAWCHFLQRTWRELEEQYWEKIYAA